MSDTTNISNMQWLHFSDFHFGRKNGAQADAMGSLVDFIRSDLGSNPGMIDAVFLVGDIANSGQIDEFAHFESDFLRPLLSIPSLKDAKVFAVPGNHDVDCDSATPITWEGIKQRNQEIYFCENDEGSRVRKPRTDVFRNYWNFVERNHIISPNPFEEVCILQNEANFPFDILAINTSFFCDKDDDSEAAITPCPLTAMRERLRNLERLRPLFILGHHPKRCFLQEHQQPFETFLVDKKAIYLHGHEHDPKLTNNTDGTIRTLGFGATYLAALGTTSHPPYRNSYAHCRLDTQLHLNGFSWDSHIGRWDDATRSQFSNCITGESYDGRSAILNIPLLANKQPAISTTPALQSIPRKTPHPQAIIPVSLPSEEIWLKLLSLSRNVSAYYRSESNPKVQSSQVFDGKIEFIVEQSDKRDLLICIPGTTHILSSKEIESYNTRLDSEDFRSVTVLSFGKKSPDARDLYSKLKSKKPIEVLDNQELTTKWQQLLSEKQKLSLASLDAGLDTVNILVDNNELYTLVVRRDVSASFRIFDAHGDILEPTHTVVATLREANSDFAKLPYDGECVTGEFPELLVFDEMKYLKQCYAEYNAIKYAALANFGIRFSDFSLEAIYIDASACEREAAQSKHIDALLDDHLAPYPASEKLKAQIKQQFQSQVAGQERHEISQAREFCQKFGAVLLTGDPGSGKTCFVKSEILAYSKRSAESPVKSDSCPDDWHSLHVPIMIPLSQAAAEADLETVGIMQIASRLLERRGFFLPFDRLNELLREGRLALFFDGLDEVVSVEKRALIVQHINDIVTQYLSLGNRVVVTSRPAAVNVVNLLPTLRQLELQGLTEIEIRTLANRILTLKLTETSEGSIVIADKDPNAADSYIIKQLLADCAEKPGVARFASNPLLLTLLVMIYANSGAPSAKRHRIYEEAIKTLASVRGRQAGHTPISVQDLRERLGAVALSVYRKESGFLPTLGEVTEIVRAVMSRQRGETVAKLDAQKFIQKVAESTGLIAVGGSDGKSDDAGVVTFMHHSFMEYFAAVGLSRELENCDVASLVTQPRWIEILTLLAGIIGESEDIAPVLVRFVGDGTSFGDVDARFLIFALDCALECEVPSEAAIRLLSVSISKCVEQGPARSDPWVRSEIGQRLSQLIDACGITSFEGTIESLIRCAEGDICASAISLTGFACGDAPESHGIIKSLEDCCTRTEETVMASICDAATRIEWARTLTVMQVVTRCLKKTARCRRAAFDAIHAIPGLAAKHWSEIVNGLDDPDLGIRRLASKAAIRAGLDGDLIALSESKKELVANAMRYVSESGGDNEYIGSKVRDETVERLLRSGYLRDRLIGIQLIPSSESSTDSAYPKLMELLSGSEDHQEMTAALRTLRSSPVARVLFSVADIRRIVEISEIGTSDVRNASIRLLGCFGADISAVKPLIDRSLKTIASSEFEAIFFALGRAQVLQDEIGAIIEREILDRTRDDVKINESYVVEICSLMDAARSLGRNLSPQATTAIRLLIIDYKQDDRVKRASLRAYAATAMPSQHVVEFLTELFQAPPVKLMGGLVQSLSAFAKNCRQSVEFVMACVDSMSGLRTAATSLHQRLSKRDVTAENEAMTTELRNGIFEISQIIVTFEEFINPARPQIN